MATAEPPEPSASPITDGPTAPASRRQSLAAALLLLVVSVSIAALATEAAIHAVVDDARISVPAALLVALLLGSWGVRQLLHGPLSLLRALAGSVQSFRDQDYSFGVHWPRHDELRELVDAHAALGEVLREQRLNLVQRELLLDSMVQHSPVAMVLTVPPGIVVFGNLAARRLLGRGARLEGHRLDELVRRLSPGFAEALARGDGLFGTGEGEAEEIYHLARRRYTPNTSSRATPPSPSCPPRAAKPSTGARCATRCTPKAPAPCKAPCPSARCTPTARSWNRRC